MVKAFVDDIQVMLGKTSDTKGCKGADPCKALDFQDKLSVDVGLIPDVSTACKA